MDAKCVQSTIRKIYVEDWVIAPIDQLDGDVGLNGRPLSASRCVDLMDRPAHQRLHPTIT